MADEPSPSQKLIVDDDWKEQAQREKEALAKALEEEARTKARPPLPPASFEVLASSIAIQAMVGLGDVRDAEGRRTPLNLPDAKFHIDLLEILEAKTKGNLTPDEAKMLEQLLFDLRMRFVERSRSGEQRPD